MLRFSIFFLTLPLCVFSQSKNEQKLYNNSIFKVEHDSKNQETYFNSDLKRIGHKKTNTEGVFYYDARYRLIKKLENNSNSSGKENTNSAVSPQISADTNASLPTSNQAPHEFFLLQGDQVLIQNGIVAKRFRNTVYYFTEKGQLLYIRKRRNFSRRVVYTDANGNTIGSKRSYRNGTTRYYDKNRRRTGESTVSGNGNIIFKSRGRRITPNFMINDPFSS